MVDYVRPLSSIGARRDVGGGRLRFGTKAGRRRVEDRGEAVDEGD